MPPAPGENKEAENDAGDSVTVIKSIKQTVG